MFDLPNSDLRVFCQEIGKQGESNKHPFYQKTSYVYLLHLGVTAQDAELRRVLRSVQCEG